MLLTFAILLVTVVFFIAGRIRADGVAVLSMIALLLCDLVTPAEALAGFSAAPVVMIAALFIVGGGLTATGITHWLGQRLIALAGSSETRLVLLVMAGTAALSGFMSNTGVVAMLLPAVLAASTGLGAPAARVLMPMAYAANLGGLLTMIGTPPNLVVNDELVQQQLAPFGFFTFAIMGLPLLAIAAVYMMVVGRKLLRPAGEGPSAKSGAGRLAGLIDSYGLESRLFELTVAQESDLVGRFIEESRLLEDYGVVTLLHRRAGDDRPQDEDAFDAEPLPIQAGDRLLVKAEPDAVARLAPGHALRQRPVTVDYARAQRVLFSKKLALVEALIPPRSSLIGSRALPGRLNRESRLQVLAMRRRGSIFRPSETSEGTVELREGDMALLRAPWSVLRRADEHRADLIILGDPRQLAVENLELDRQSYTAVAVLVGMVILMLTGALPALTCTLLAAAAMVMSGCISLEDSYREINWQSVVLIAAMFPMATAIENSGGASWLANGIAGLTADSHPVFLLGGVFLLTNLLSQVISNTAATILIVPIVVATAGSMELSVYPLLMGVAVAASISLLTPIGTVPNLLVMAPAGFTFADYLKCGLPLTALLFAATVVLIPMVWPF